MPGGGQRAIGPVIPIGDLTDNVWLLCATGAVEAVDSVTALPSQAKIDNRWL